MKTSTGYGPSGATVEDVRLMRSNLLPEIQIKAAGGIRNLRRSRADAAGRSIAARNEFRHQDHRREREHRYDEGRIPQLQSSVPMPGDCVSTLIEINHEITSILDLDELLNKIAELTQPDRTVRNLRDLSCRRRKAGALPPVCDRPSSRKS